MDCSVPENPITQSVLSIWFDLIQSHNLYILTFLIKKNIWKIGPVAHLEKHKPRRLGTRFKSKMLNSHYQY